MAIVDGGWLSWAARLPGPVEKQYNQPNSAQGYVPHSAVGFYGGWESRLFDMTRDSSGRFTSYAAVSVHGWIAYDGKVSQHYPFTASCWASGNFHANTNFIAFENEGGFSPYDEPLTPQQTSANTRIIQELSNWKGWEPSRPKHALDITATLYEHTECVKIWGGAATACPSARIPWDEILRAFEEDDMTEYKLAIQWNPAMTWLIAYVLDVPIYKRYIAFPQTVAHLQAGLGEPETFSKENLAKVPTL